MTTSKERADVLWPVVHGLGTLHEAVGESMASIIAYLDAKTTGEFVGVLREAATMVRETTLTGNQDVESRELTAEMVEHYADFCEKWVEL